MTWYWWVVGVAAYLLIGAFATRFRSLAIRRVARKNFEAGSSGFDKEANYLLAITLCAIFFWPVYLLVTAGAWLIVGLLKIALSKREVKR